MRICVCDSGSGMELFMDRFQSVLIDVRINLGGRDVRVPEQLLNDPEIRAVTQQVSRKRVS